VYEIFYRNRKNKKVRRVVHVSSLKELGEWAVRQEYELGVLITLGERLDSGEA